MSEWVQAFCTMQGYHSDTPVTQEYQARGVWWGLRTSQPALHPVQAADTPCKTEADS